MAGEQIPITPNVVRWARERAGYSLEDATKSFKKIEAWEAGAASPTYPQLEQLADTFKVPVAVFFFPEPPELPPIAETFRTLPEATFAEIPRRVRQLLQKAKAFQLNLVELYQGQNPAERLITEDLALNQIVNVEVLADQVRAYLGVSLGEQTAWVSDDEALKQWRAELYRVGIFVFKDGFKAPDFSGFCLFDDVFPIIYVNNTAAKTRQIFTLFHELAHLLFHTSGIDTVRDTYIPDLPENSRQIEILCNRFAAQFLIPDNVFDAAIAGLEPTEATATILASRYHVSREMIFRKFLDRTLIDEETYAEAAVRWAGQLKGEDGGNPYWTKITYLGREYINRALGLYHQNRIDQKQLGEYLDWKPRYLETLEEYFSRGGE